MSLKKLWAAFAAVAIISFAVLIYYGVEIYREAPPIPEQIVTQSGEVLFTRTDVLDGQNVWQSMGAQEVDGIVTFVTKWLHLQGGGKSKTSTQNVEIESSKK